MIPFGMTFPTSRRSALWNKNLVSCISGDGQAYLVFFSTAGFGFSQNWLKGSEFCLKNILCYPLTFLRPSSASFSDCFIRNGIVGYFKGRNNKTAAPLSGGKTPDMTSAARPQTSNKGKVTSSIDHALQAKKKLGCISSKFFSFSNAQSSLAAASDAAPQPQPTQ